MIWYCNKCNFKFDDDAPLQAKCPQCGIADYRVMPILGKKRLLSSKAEEMLSVGAGLAIAVFNYRGFSFWTIALVFAVLIQLAAIITKSEHYLDTIRLTLAQNDSFNLLAYFLLGFLRNLTITVVAAVIINLII